MELSSSKAGLVPGRGNHLGDIDDAISTTDVEPNWEFQAGMIWAKGDRIKSLTRQKMVSIESKKKKGREESGVKEKKKKKKKGEKKAKFEGVYGAYVV